MKDIFNLNLFLLLVNLIFIISNLTFLYNAYPFYVYTEKVNKKFIFRKGKWVDLKKKYKIIGIVSIIQLILFGAQIYLFALLYYAIK